VSKLRKYRSRAPEFLRDLQEQAFITLRENGLQAGLAEDIANSLARHMCQHWGGQLLYFPKGESLHRATRDMQIYREFNGTNQAELAQKYDTSTQHVYRIIEAVRADEMARRQPELKLEGGSSCEESQPRS
jgi:Mor family transcriptional regulator